MAYLLSAIRTDPGARGYHDHLGVWATLEDAQAYSDKLGGVGEWETTQHDSVEYWARDTTTPAISHLIEGIAHIAGGEPATTATIETDAAR